MALFLAALFALFAFMPARHGGAFTCLAEAQDDYGSVFRLHVIANSDSEKDQAVKLRVRDAVLAYERARMADVSTAEEARQRLMEDGAGLLATVEQTLRAAGMEYGAYLETGVFPFPERVYGDAVYPAGDYSALRIVLGAGKGQNWWCVMFPPLCILELPGGEIDYKELKTNSFFIKLLKSIDGGKLWDRIKEKLR
ncbi:stage II sporulation protein R [bacterium]|nr:stage II sporulation protein R [bacterium]